MFNKNKDKIIQEQKNQELNNKKPSTFKNLYAKIRQNIKTSFPRSKQKNSINIIKSKRLTENANKKNNNSNMNLIFTRKTEESRNYKTHKEPKIIYDNNHDIDELFDYDDNNENIYFNKTQKNVNLLTKNNSKKIIIANLKIAKNDCKYDEQDMNYMNNQLNYYSNKDEIKKNNTQDKYLYNKNIKSNKDIKKLVIGNNLDKKDFIENNDSKNKNIGKEGKDSLDKMNKLFVNKKIISKEDLFKTKNLYGKVQSARLVNYDSQKLNINITQDLNSEMKSNSKKKTIRMNSQKIVQMKNKEFESKTRNEIKRIKKNKILKQSTRQNSKNHNMSINLNNKTLLLNKTIKDNMYKTKKKYSIVNIYNYPNVLNNNRQYIPFDRDMVFDSGDKKNKDNSENIGLNNYYNMDHTCFNFKNNINMNNTINNNNNNGTIINMNEKNTPNSKCHKSFIKPYSQEKISSIFYSKPVARLKKRIFNSPSDKNINNSINYICVKNKDYRDIDSLEINNNNKKDNTNNYKELLIYIKILNQIINSQKKIIKDYIENEIILKEEIEQKEKEILNYKNTCLKLIFYLKQEKDINISSDINKKRNKIQNQLIKENNILRNILGSSIFLTQKNRGHRNTINNLDIYSKSFTYSNISNINEADSSKNIYYLKNDKEKSSNINLHKIKYNDNSRDNNNNSLNSLYYNQDIILNNNKKREKSYENRRHQINRGNRNIYNNDNNSIIDNLGENGVKSNKKICYIVKDKNIAFSFEKKIF